MTLLGAQSAPPRPDATKRVTADSTKRVTADSTKRVTADSTKRVEADTVKRPSGATAKPAPKRPPRDTVKTPIARPYTPRSTEIGANDWHWDRDELFASGALNLADLLKMVPGVTIMSTGFILAPQVAAYYGDPGRVRIFADGVELDVLNPRNGGIQDLALLPLWSVEDVKIERAAGELRVHLRQWRVDRTTPNTRTDVATGSENLNLYRGFFGKRFDNGALVQLAGQQQSNISVGGMDGDALGGMARVGWARGDWSVDATWLHQGINRNSGAKNINTIAVRGAIPPYRGSEGFAYLRFAWRDPETNGPWAQFIASSLSEAKTDTNSNSTASLVNAVKDSTDSTTSRAQYVLAAGFTRWGILLSSTNRLRSIHGKSYFTPGARAEYASKLLTLSAFAERTVDSTLRTDASARLAPFAWFNIGGSVSRSAPKSAQQGAAIINTRFEAGLEWHHRWITAGLVTRTASLVAPPIEIDTALRPVVSPAAKGVIVSIRGPLVFGLNAAVDAVKWSVTGPYRPQTQARARLWFESSFLQHFPRNNFHLLVSVSDDYFSTMYVPLGTNPTGQSSAGAAIPSTLLEIRIATAVIFWQYRNPAGAIYNSYPGYVMPRLVNVYGVRWQFWN